MTALGTNFAQPAPGKSCDALAVWLPLLRRVDARYAHANLLVGAGITAARGGGVAVADTDHEAGARLGGVSGEARQQDDGERQSNKVKIEYIRDHPQAGLPRHLFHHAQHLCCSLSRMGWAPRAGRDGGKVSHVGGLPRPRHGRARGVGYRWSRVHLPPIREGTTCPASAPSGAGSSRG